MLVQSTRLGTIEVPEGDIIKFPQGLPGFPDERSFAFVPYGEGSPFAFLQSIIEPNLTFLVVEPFGFIPDYTFELDDTIVNQFSLDSDNPPQIFNIVTVPAKVDDMTANLLAPVIINRKSQTAAQVVLEKTPYTTKHRLFPLGTPQQASKGGK